MRLAFWALYLSMFLTGSIGVRVGGASIYLNSVTLLVVVAIALVAGTLRRGVELPAWLWLVLLPLVAALFFSMFFHTELAGFVQAAQIIIFLAGILSTLLVVESPADVRRWLTVTTIGCGANAIVGVYQSAAWILTNGLVLIAGDEWFRVKGLFVSPIDYVTVLMIGLALSMAIERTAVRVFVAATYSLLLILSMSRSGIIVVAIFIAIALSAVWRTRGNLVLKAGALVMLLFGAIAVSSVQLVASRIADIGNAGFNVARFATYRDAWAQSTSDPLHFLLGHGLGSYSFFNESAQEVFTNTHNVYLLFLYSTGLVGLILFLMLVGGLLRACLRAVRAMRGSGQVVRLPISVLLLHVFVWLVAMVETNILDVGSGWLIGAVLAIPVVLMRLRTFEPAT